jgi:hypothetical protein
MITVRDGSAGDWNVHEASGVVCNRGFSGGKKMAPEMAPECLGWLGLF